MTSASAFMRATASAGSSVPSNRRVTSSRPSTKTKLRTLENWELMACTRCSVKRANDATDPEMSAMTMISGLAGWGGLKRRSIGTPPVDRLRHTVWRSLSTGGVPMDLRFKPPHPAKPEIIVIADISGSVASFARFTLHLVHAISSQFSKVRSFVFVDGLDEVTRLFEGTDEPAEAVARINAEADVIAFDGHSDYGRALLTFHEAYADEITRRATILILGDARNNYHQAHAEVLADLRYRAKAVYWLNPEPTSYWNSGDSIIGQYAPYCDRVIECRTLRQLEAFVGAVSY